MLLHYTPTLSPIYEWDLERSYNGPETDLLYTGISTLAVVAVVVVSFFLNGAKHVSNIHYLTNDEKCAIYEQVMDGIVLSE